MVLMLGVPISFPKHVVVFFLIPCVCFSSYAPDSFGCLFSSGAVGHHGDNLAEKILSVLPKLPGHKTDVMVNMVEVTTLKTTDEACSIIAPGCLAQPK